MLAPGSKLDIRKCTPLHTRWPSFPYSTSRVIMHTPFWDEKFHLCGYDWLGEPVEANANAVLETAIKTRENPFAAFGYVDTPVARDVRRGADVARTRFSWLPCNRVLMHPVKI